jgi:methionyl-tRNA formyltransferase
MKVLDAAMDVPVDFPPGTIFADKQRMLVICAQRTWLEFVEVQLEGKKRISAADFLHGNIHATGIRLG